MKSRYLNSKPWAKALICAVVVASINANAGEYSVAELGALGSNGERTEVKKMSDNGIVSGAMTVQNARHAFVKNGTDSAVDIGTLGGRNSVAYDVNDKGDVVGYSNVNRRDNHAFIYTINNGIVDIGTLGGRGSYAEAVNDNGVVVGYSMMANGRYNSFIYDDNGMQSLGTLGGNTSYAFGVNNLREVVGVSEMAGGTRHAFLYDTSGNMSDLGTLGGSYSVAWDINNNGRVVGFSYNADNLSRGFSYDQLHGMEELPTLGGSVSIAYAVNDNGKVVGSAENSNRKSRATLWIAGDVVDLNELVEDTRWTLTRAIDINNEGEIIVVGEGNGPRQQLLLVPTFHGDLPLRYTVVHLRDFNDVFEINELGHVAGQIVAKSSNGNYYQAGVWREGQFVALGVIGCRSTVSSCSSSSFSINGDSVITGSTSVANTFSPYYQHAFVTVNDVMEQITTLGWEFSSGESINDAGHITGYSRDTYCNPVCSYQTHAFLWRGNNDVIDLGTLGGNRSYGNAINNLGTVVGYSDVTGNKSYHAVRWVNERIEDLGTLGGSYSQAVDINDNGKIVGNGFTTGGKDHAFLWDSVIGMTDLGAFKANAINSAGVIAGKRNRKAVIYEDNTLLDLNHLISSGSGWTLWEARDINSDGVVVGVGDKGVFMLMPL